MNPNFFLALRYKHRELTLCNFLKNMLFHEKHFWHYYDDSCIHFFFDLILRTINIFLAFELGLLCLLFLLDAFVLIMCSSTHELK